jgi:hypothetical protein
VEGGWGERSLPTWSYREASNGHEATAASGGIATARTAVRTRAALGGGGKLERRSKQSRTSKMPRAGPDGKSGSGNEMFDGSRFRPDSWGCGMGVHTSLEGAHDWQQWGQGAIMGWYRWGSVRLSSKNSP